MYISQEKIIWKIAEAAAEYIASREDEAAASRSGRSDRIHLTKYYKAKAEKNLFLLETIADLITIENGEMKATAREFITLMKKAIRHLVPYQKKLDMYDSYIRAKEYPDRNYKLEQKLQENAARQLEKAQKIMNALKGWRAIER